MRFRCPLILASASPRRKKLLEQLGLDFIVQASDVDESFEAGTPPDSIVRTLAQTKAEAISQQYSDALVLAADTIVVLEDDILGKPTGNREAAQMLTRLSGKTHTVFTGIALIHRPTSRTITAFESTRVTFAPMTQDEIQQYVATGSPLDKAGAYGIQDDQGALYIERIEGDYYNVVGLPVHRLYKTVCEYFGDLLV